MDGLAESNEVYSGAFQEILEKKPLYILFWLAPAGHFIMASGGMGEDHE